MPESINEYKLQACVNALLGIAEPMQYLKMFPSGIMQEDETIDAFLVRQNIEVLKQMYSFVTNAFEERIRSLE